jgi:hypothetical protein
MEIFVENSFSIFLRLRHKTKSNVNDNFFGKIIIKNKKNKENKL